jgi:hypothetical protein
MDDVEGFRKLVGDLNLEEITDIEEIRELCVNIDKYLEWRLATVKNLEGEIFAKCIKLAETRSKLLHSANDKIKKAETMVPYQDSNLRKYFLNRVFCFDTISDRVCEAEEFSLPSSLADKFKGLLPTKLILKDAKAKLLEYVLIYSVKTYEIQEVYNFNKEKQELITTEPQEISNLIGKLKSFVGENYCGTRDLSINDLQRFLDKGSKDKWELSSSKKQNQSSFLFDFDD